MVNINDLELNKILVGNPIKMNVEYKEKDKLAFLDRSDNLIAIGIIEDGMGAPKKVIRNNAIKNTCKNFLKSLLIDFEGFLSIL